MNFFKHTMHLSKFEAENYGSQFKLNHFSTICVSRDVVLNKKFRKRLDLMVVC